MSKMGEKIIVILLLHNIIDDLIIDSTYLKVNGSIIEDDFKLYYHKLKFRK